MSGRHWTDTEGIVVDGSTLLERLERVARDEFGHLTLAELEAIDGHSGQYADLKIDRDGWRVWLSRLDVADGVPFDNAVEVERLIDGRWVEVARWEAPA